MPDDGEDLPTEVRPGPDDAEQSVSRFAAGQLLAGRYRIISALGRGGMGEVFRAEDRRLNQEVALKFLPAGADSPLMLQQLASEVRLGRAVSHPNVCRLYDLVEEHGLTFLTMEYVEGKDLASLLRQIGRLPFEKAVALSHDLCSGLAAAHDLGVIHRDLKPANIMIDGRGRARITDFGLAVANSDARLREIAGTPSYMAPEQLDGATPDVRSDIYSLGTVLFEMFTGKRLYDANSFQEVRALHREPKPLPSSLVRELTPDLERVILTCVDELPERRPSSAREVIATLPAAGVAGANSPRSPNRETPRSGRDANSLAVLPFDDLTPGASDDSFSTGLAEEIISDLSKIRALRVISRGSAMRYRGTTDLMRVAEELQVAHLLTGSVRRAGDQLRLTANLVNGRTDEIVWSEKFKGSVGEVFDIQEAVARTVAEQLRVQLTSGESARIAERPIEHPLAFEYYVRARNEIWKFSSEALANAEKLLERAMEVVGENAVIYSAMAYVEWQYYNAGIDVDERHLARAEELAKRVFELKPDSPGGHRILGLVAVSRGNVIECARELRRVLESDPNDIDALAWLALVYMMADREDLARPLARHLEQIDPFGLMSLMAQMIVPWLTVDVEEGLRVAALARELHDATPFRYFGAIALAFGGRKEESIRRFDEVSQRHADFFGDLSAFMSAALRNDRPAALSIFRERLATPAWTDLQFSAEVAAGLSVIGETDQSIEWLQNAVARGFTPRAFIEWRNPMFENVRKHPRFVEVMQQLSAKAAEFDRAIG